jgi:uncharacterized protein YbjT (DUF2867 family)
MNILVAGANGFVGKSLIRELLEAGHTVTALVRHLDHSSKEKNIKWIQGDLLDFSTLPKLKAFDKAYYLVHGLKSESDKFEFDEAMAAVNFIKWIRPTNADLIYLGGLGPDTGKESPHLRSRHLTGAILGISGLNVTEFRASIIIGEGSLSFEMIKAMAERFPFLPDMKLLSEPCQPLALQDLMKYLLGALETPPVGHDIVEIGGPDVTTYGELLEMYSELAGLKRKKVKLPEVETKVLSKAMDYAIPEHSQIGRKLIESLSYPTVVKDHHAKKLFPTVTPMELRAAMDLARSKSETKYPPIWEKDFLRTLLSDKILTQSGFLSPDLLRNLEKVGKIKEMLTRKT